MEILGIVNGFFKKGKPLNKEQTEQEIINKDPELRKLQTISDKVDDLVIAVDKLLEEKAKQEELQSLKKKLNETS